MTATAGLPIDTTEGLNKMRRCAALLPEPAPEIVVALVDEVLRLRSFDEGTTELERASAAHKEAVAKAEHAKMVEKTIGAHYDEARVASDTAWQAVRAAEKELIRVSSGARGE